MSYEWYDQIDQLGYAFEDAVGQAAASHSMLGMAPSAGDEARARLRRVAGALTPLDLLAEVEGTTRAEVLAATEAVAKAAVEAAVRRGSRHVTREDVSAAISKVAAYPYTR